MHPSVLNWVEAKAKINLDSWPNKYIDVLEVGSQDINGTVRYIFDGCRTYVGVDMMPGKGVDIISLASALPFKDANFDMVVSTEMLEHDLTFWKSLAEMRRVLRVGGCLLLTARGCNNKGIAMWEHSYPHDYYRFMPECFAALLPQFGFKVIEVVADTWPRHIGYFAMALAV